MRSPVEDTCVSALTNEAEEQKRGLANAESGNVSRFSDLEGGNLLPTDGEPAERRGNDFHQPLHHEILDEVIFVVLFCLACMFPTRKECFILNGVPCLLIRLGVVSILGH